VLTDDAELSRQPVRIFSTAAYQPESPSVGNGSRSSPPAEPPIGANAMGHCTENMSLKAVESTVCMLADEPPGDPQRDPINASHTDGRCNCSSSAAACPRALGRYRTSSARAIKLERMLLIDAANVVGSRPTGWWRDRAGAARGFVAQVRAAVDSGRITQPVVVVLEGQAREGAPRGLAGGVVVLYADGSGDDTLVEVLANAPDQTVTLVTADRELRRRAEALGATVVGPRWLLELLEQ